MAGRYGGRCSDFSSTSPGIRRRQQAATKLTSFERGARLDGDLETDFSERVGKAFQRSGSIFCIVVATLVAARL
jgi:hypothetical protein